MIKQVEGKHIVFGKMNNEWNRFSSFSTFPPESKAMPLRLAQAGFFYSGYNEEAICFYCGLKNNIWRDDEAVLDAHKRLSPRCGFISGEGTNNIAINGHKSGEGTNNIAIHGHKTLTSKDVRSQKTDFDQHDLRHVETQNCSLSESARVDSKTENVLNNSQAKTQNMQSDEIIFNHASRKENDMVHASFTDGQVQLYPGVGDEKPKHPDYMLENIRLSSFSKWPVTGTLSIQPHDLARAGFFYTGYSDCVRCFFCGGGLNSWDSEDNPWIEHAKWLPDCAYVKLCKGQAFVNMCTASRSSGLVGNDEVGTYNGLENIPEDWLIEHLNSHAAKLVLADGYNQQDVEKAILFVRERYGHEEVKSQYIMEFMHQTNAVKKSTLQSNISHRDSEHEASRQPLADNWKPVQHFEVISNNSGNTDLPDTNKSEKEQLFEENRKLKDLATCKVCMDNEACVAFLPCGHLTSCVKCAKSLQKCAVCRADVLGTVRVYKC